MESRLEEAREDELALFKEEMSINSKGAKNLLKENRYLNLNDCTGEKRNATLWRRLNKIKFSANYVNFRFDKANKSFLEFVIRDLNFQDRSMLLIGAVHWQATSRDLIAICSASHKIRNSLTIDGFELSNKQFWRLFTSFKNFKSINFYGWKIQIDKKKEIWDGLKNSNIGMIEFHNSWEAQYSNWKANPEWLNALLKTIIQSKSMKENLKYCYVLENNHMNLDIRRKLASAGFKNFKV